MIVMVFKGIKSKSISQLIMISVEQTFTLHVFSFSHGFNLNRINAMLNLECGRNKRKQTNKKRLI